MRDGKQSSGPPTEYIIYLWRKMMHVSYIEAMRTPYRAILADLEFASLEEEYRPAEPESN